MAARGECGMMIEAGSGMVFRDRLQFWAVSMVREQFGASDAFSGWLTRDTENCIVLLAYGPGAKPESALWFWDHAGERESVFGNSGSSDAL